MSSAASCRSTAASSASPSRCRPWPIARPIARRTARTSPTAAPCPASMRGSRRRRARSATRGAAPRGRRRPALCRRRRAAGGSRRHRPLARDERLGASWRAGACGACAARSTCSAFILAGLDLRQNSDVHERTVAELLEAAVPGHRLCRPAEDDARRRLLEELADGAAAGLARSWPIRRRPQLGAGDLARPRRGARRLTVRQRCPTT